MMQTMMGAAAPKKAEPEAADPFGTGAFMKMMQGFMAASTGQSPEKPKAEAKPEPVEASKPVDLSKYSELVGSLFDSGLEVQKSYQKSMEQIFDGYMKGLNGNGK